jgi:hydroxymethylbilane synthase
LRSLRLATRGSALARAQAGLSVEALRRHGAETVELVVVRTQGDRARETPFDRMRGQGWFTAALERALQEGRADLAVHSAKDLPSRLAGGLPVLAFLERGDCRDGVVTRPGEALDSLPAGARVGTSSPRRAGLLAELRDDLRTVPLRGNVDTRLAKLDAGEVDALLVACAGLDRIGRGDRVGMRLDPRTFVPAPCQGAIALQGRPGTATRSAAAADDPATRTAAAAERGVLAALGGGCLLPLGAWARMEGERLVLTAALEVEGRIRRAELDGDPGAPAELGRRVADRLR